MTDHAVQQAALVDAAGFPLPETSPVVILDDDPDLGRSLGAYLTAQGYPVRVHASAQATVADLAKTPAGLLLVDLNLQSENGLDVARQALELDPSLAIILITGHGSEDAAIACLRLGLSDYLVKPFDLSTLGRAVQRALLRRASEVRRFRNEERLRQRITELQSARREAAVRALGQIVWSLEAKHACLRGHSLRVAALSRALGEELGLPETATARLRMAGLVHDVGMIAVPDEVLQHTGTLDADDLHKIRRHPALGAELVRTFGLTEAATFVEFHHERLDGSGYPSGLRGSEIPGGALIVGLAEAYSALTEERPFREAASPPHAVDTLRGVAGVWFPGRMIEALERAHARVEPDPEPVPEPALEDPPGLRLV